MSKNQVSNILLTQGTWENIKQRVDKRLNKRKEEKFEKFIEEIVFKRDNNYYRNKKVISKFYHYFKKAFDPSFKYKQLKKKEWKINKVTWQDNIHNLEDYICKCNSIIYFRL